MTKIKFGVTSVDYSASIENTPTIKLGLIIRGSGRLDASSVIKKLIKDVSELEYELEE
ncbi:Uncharacterised protein [Streptococcus pneumoniae]|uniref:Uncharacterized protein n=3 Tax=root TaxID=1 RepID=A0A141DZJ4_9CAUD|nr:hypothetical protein [Streptococcus pneumoniae]YP_009322100.1 hypothetical protein BOW96_gp18 [Streptococcus phage phiARI0468-4]YP_010665064.1 hypothetical protein PQB32_gp34 [Streptococcus phage IPP66]ALH47352.1 hypothetical protein phiARI0378_20 [Streptococcus phage phiARI0378]ALH47403.1 hypothetical protein phiARI0285-2_19 [Streptococcus phage phiARI0285-2]ALA46903.1 hypothetical protein phiARI0468-4_18 [Streptococcus phage phiARI0468-4]APD24451.1 hypothetical protein IPP66_00034 [Strep